MTTALERFRSTVAPLLPHYPAERYGQAGALIPGSRVVGRRDHFEVYPSKEAQFYNCGTASLQIYQALKAADLHPNLIRLYLILRPTVALLPSIAIKHFLVSVDLGDQQALVGVTPFDRAWGIKPWRLFSTDAFYSWLKERRGFFCGPKDIATSLQFSYGFHTYLLAAYPENDDTFYLAEGSFNRGWLFWRFSLSVSRLRSDPAALDFKVLGSVTRFVRIFRFAEPSPKSWLQSSVGFDAERALALAEPAWQGMNLAIRSLVLGQLK